MKWSVYYVCFLLFMLLEVKTSKTGHNVLLHRLIRAVNSRNQNISLYNTDPNWYNSRPPASNGTGSQWNKPGDYYDQRYPPNPNNPTNVGSRPQNVYGYNTNPNWYNLGPPASNGTESQWNKPGDYYDQRYLHNPNYPTNVGIRPQNVNGYNTTANWYNPGLPASNGSGSQWNKPGDYYDQRHSYNPNDPTNVGSRPQNVYGYNTDPNRYNPRPPPSNSSASQWNYPNNYYNQRYLHNPNDPTQTGSGPQNVYGYNNDQNRYDTPPPGWTGSGPQWNSNGNYYPNPNNPTQIGGRPQNTSWYNPNPNEYNSKPTTWNNTGPQWNSLGNQYYPVPNDLTLHQYKRSANSRLYNDPNWHSNRAPSWNSTRSYCNNTRSHNCHGNFTNLNYTTVNSTHRVRWIRAIHHSTHRNISWYNIDPNWYNIKPDSNVSSPEWNRPGGGFYQWNRDDRNNATYKCPWNEEHQRHHHNHHHHHYDSLPSPPYFRPSGPPAPPLPGRPGPPQFGPPPNFGHRWPPRFNPPPPNFNNTIPGPEGGAGANGTVVNGTSVLIPGNEVGLNGTNVNSTNSWGPELPDLNGYDEDDSTPAPQ